MSISSHVTPLHLKALNISWKAKAVDLKVDARDMVNSPTLLELRARTERLGVKITDKCTFALSGGCRGD